MKQRITTFGPLFIILAAFLWSLDGLLRQFLYSLPSTVVVLLEHGLAFLFMLPLLWWRRSELRKLDAGSWLAVLWVVVWGGVLGTTFYTKALSHTGYISLSVVVLLQKLQPVFALLLASALLKEKLPPRFFGWAAFALAGGYLVSFPQLLPNFATGDQTGLAALLAVGAAFAWGSSTVFGKRSLRQLDFRTLTSLRFGLTTLAMAVIVLVGGQTATIGQVSSTQWGYVLAIVFSTGAAAIFLYYYGLRLVTASVSTICELFWPVSAVFLDLFLRGNVLSATQWLGAAVLLFSIFQVARLQTQLR